MIWNTGLLRLHDVAGMEGMLEIKCYIVSQTQCVTSKQDLQQGLISTMAIAQIIKIQLESQRSHATFPTGACPNSQIARPRQAP